MRIDVVTIFPDYLVPLELSLPGKARTAGLLDVRVHDLRTWTHDPHRTVDDAPYGGGAGMVMQPHPWGDALDELGVNETTLLIPTPAGRLHSQSLAAELATRDRLLIACGRYEGIDERVAEHYRSRTEVIEVSVGDYVLNGAEVAALALIESVTRLIPGFMGNVDSLIEESHEGGLLEYPHYTKPRTWRGLDVPQVLLSGDHGRIAAWRHEQRLRRTAVRRPDLLSPASAPGEIELGPAVPADAGELLTMQRACWAQVQPAHPDREIYELRESLDDLRAWMGIWTVLVGRRGGRLVVAARGRLSAEGWWEVGRLMVAPDLQGQGLGRWLLAQIEDAAPDGVSGFELVTCAGSRRHLAMYRKAGYRESGSLEPGVVRLVKRPISD